MRLNKKRDALSSDDLPLTKYEQNLEEEINIIRTEYLHPHRIIRETSSIMFDI